MSTPAPGPAPTTERQPHPLWKWAKTRPLEMLPILGFLVAIASFLLIAIPEIGQGQGKQLWTNLIAHGYVLIWMTVATFVVRTIGIRQVITAFFSGFFLATTVAILLSRPLLDWFGHNDLTVALWVPLVEELAKTIPLILMIWSYSRRVGQSHGVSELMLVGFAIGGGMAVHEDLMYGRTVASSGGTLFGSFAEPWGAVFPTFFTGSGTTLAGHGGWGAVIGLGLGLAAVYRRKRVLALVFAIVGVVVAVIDHSAINMRGDLAGLVTALSLQHYLVVTLLLVGFPLAIVYDVLRRRHRPPALPKPTVKLYRAGLLSHGDPWHTVINFFALGHYRRGWTAAAYDRSGGGRGHDYPRLAAWYRVVVPAAPVADPTPAGHGTGG